MARARNTGNGRLEEALAKMADQQMALMQLQATLNKTIVFITHDLDEALRIGNRIAISSAALISGMNAASGRSFGSAV